MPRYPSNFSSRFLAGLLVSGLLLLFSGPTADAQNVQPTPPEWFVDEAAGKHTVIFDVDDPTCAYRIIADPAYMAERLPHVKSFTVHTSKPGFMDLSITEVYIRLSKGTSRYHRWFDGSRNVRWELQEGRAKVHDGTWKVTPTPGGASVTFTNKIKAKRSFNQPLIRWVQRATMRDIVSATRKHCGQGI